MPKSRRKWSCFLKHILYIPLLLCLSVCRLLFHSLHVYVSACSSLHLCLSLCVCPASILPSAAAPAGDERRQNKRRAEEGWREKAAAIRKRVSPIRVFADWAFLNDTDGCIHACSCGIWWEYCIKNQCSLRQWSLAQHICNETTIILEAADTNWYLFSISPVLQSSVP